MASFSNSLNLEQAWDPIRYIRTLREFYKMVIPADSVARAIAYSIEQPADLESTKS